MQASVILRQDNADIKTIFGRSRSDRVSLRPRYPAPDLRLRLAQTKRHLVLGFRDRQSRRHHKLQPSFLQYHSTLFQRDRHGASGELTSTGALHPLHGSQQPLDIDPCGSRVEALCGGPSRPASLLAKRSSTSDLLAVAANGKLLRAWEGLATSLNITQKFALPLLSVSAALHWLVSQSIFFVRLTVYATATREGGPGISDSVTTCGYSVIALLCTLILGSVALLAPIVLGFRRVRQDIPVGATNSAVVSAACHRPHGDEDAALCAVTWGCPKVQEKPGSDVGHCCFTSLEVHSPIEGAEYM